MIFYCHNFVNFDKIIKAESHGFDLAVVILTLSQPS